MNPLSEAGFWAKVDSKGRHPRQQPGGADGMRGELNHNAVLTADVVREIRRLSADGRTARAIASQIGASMGAVEGVIGRRTWAHVA